MVEQLINSVRIVQNICESMDCQLVDFEYDAEREDEIKLTLRLPIKEDFMIIPKNETARC